MKRRGLTLLELLLSVVLTVGLMGMLWTMWSSTGRQGLQIEEASDHMNSVILLQEALTWDLRRSLPLGVLPPATVAPGIAAASVTLPLQAGYDGFDDVSRRYRILRYVFDPASRTLRRDAEVLPLPGVVGVRFRWVREEGATFLEVTVEGESGIAVRAPRFTLRLPAPAGTDLDGVWRYATHHRGARRLEVLEEGEEAVP